MASEKPMRVRTYLAAELRRHPWALPGVALTASAAFGSALPDLIAFVRGAF